MRKAGAMLLALALVTAAAAQDSGLKSELDDLKAKVAALESAKATTVVVEELPDGVVSMRQAGKVTVGGSIWAAAYASNYKRGQQLEYDGNLRPGAWAASQSRNDKIIRSDVYFNTADLDLRVEASENTELYIKFNINDAWFADGVYGQDEYLREAYVNFKDILCSGFGVKVGKMDTPKGLSKDDLLLSPYVVGGSDMGLYPAAWGLGNEDGPEDMMGAFGNSKITDVYGVNLYGSFFRDLLKFEAMLFQDRGSFRRRTALENGVTPWGRSVRYGGASYGGRDLFHRRTNDDFAFRSFATNLTLSPLEGLDFVFSFTNRFNRAAENDDWARLVLDAAGNFESANPRYTRNAQIYSAGIDWKLPFCGIFPIEVFAQYQRGENNGFRKDDYSDNIHFGTVLSFRENLRLNLQGEWMRVKNKSANYVFNGPADNIGHWDSVKGRFWRALAAVEYDFDRGPTLEVGWQGEWYKRSGSEAVFNNFSSYGNIWYAGLKYDF